MLMNKRMAESFWEKMEKEKLEKRIEQKAKKEPDPPATSERQKALKEKLLEKKREREEWENSPYKKESKLLSDAIKIHRSVLKRNLERAVVKNDYGAVIADNTDEVLQEFFDSIGLDMNLIGFESAKRDVTLRFLFLEHEDLTKGFDLATIPTDGHEFEHWVADGLNAFGWDAQVTSATGDQGIDVIAEMHGMKVGLQCKLFSSPVGNKAVQEAFAGKTFHQTDAVCVMSNASYTPSAQKLATDTGVKLLSHHDIPNLYEKMFNG